MKGENKDLMQKIEDMRKKMVNQDELIKIMTDKITRYESISHPKKVSAYFLSHGAGLWSGLAMKCIIAFILCTLIEILNVNSLF